MWIAVAITLILIVAFTWILCSSAKSADQSMDRYCDERIKSVNLKQNKNINKKGE